jgi:hypothetical protein
MFRRIAIVAALATFAVVVSVDADEYLSPQRPYDGIQAGIDAWRVGEARRLDAIDRQIGWNQLFRWQAATQTSSSIVYNPYIGEYDYAFGLNAASGPWAPSAFDFRPIWGYGYYESIRQPIGQRQIQTGPNRWESHPIYADDVRPAVVGSIVEPAIVPAPAEPVAPVPPASPTRRGREF